MEIIAQWLDDVDDFVATLGLLAERFRTVCIATTLLTISFALQVAAVLLALRHPPLASATATMLIVFLMYRSATAPTAAIARST